MGELELRHFARRIGLLFALIAGLLVFGTVGLSLSEGTNVWDSFVWALDIVATVGSIQAPTDVAGQIVKVVLIVLGVGTLLYAPHRRHRVLRRGTPLGAAGGPKDTPDDRLVD